MKRGSLPNSRSGNSCSRWSRNCIFTRPPPGWRWISSWPTNGGGIPIETKSAERVTSADARSVEIFLVEHPMAAHVGLVVYAGDEVVELRRNVWGVPDWYLLGAL